MSPPLLFLALQSTSLVNIACRCSDLYPISPWAGLPPLIPGNGHLPDSHRNLLGNGHLPDSHRNLPGNGHLPDSHPNLPGNGHLHRNLPDYMSPLRMPATEPECIHVPAPVPVSVAPAWDVSGVSGGGLVGHNTSAMMWVDRDRGWDL